MTKLKTALYLSAALLMSTAAQAQWETNWLLGISGGYGETKGNLNVTMLDSDGDQTTFSRNLEGTGAIWGALAGYQARCNGWLVGGELSVDWQDTDKSNSFAFTDADGEGWLASSRFKQDALVALTARLGYMVSPYFLPYLRAGVETSRDKLSYNALSTTDLAVDGEGRHRSYRFIGGVGAEVPLCMFRGLSLRLEYNYHSRGKSVDTDTLASDDLTFVSASTKQHANTGKASLVWNFPT